MKTRREFFKSAAGGALAGVFAPGIATAHARETQTREAGVSLEQAQELHDRLLIIDSHNDTTVARVARGENPLGWKQRNPDYHTDIPRMKEAGYDVGFFIVGNGPSANVWITIDRTLSQIEKYPEELMLVLSSQDARRARETGRIGILMAIEGAGRWLDGKADILGMFYRLGVRSVAITHGEGGSEPIYLQGTRSPFGLCTPEDREAERRNAGALTPFGLEVLQANLELGMITDLAHINDRAYYDVLERSSHPPLVSHTAVFSLCNHWRCLTDDQIKALASAGGVMGIAFAPQFIHPDPEQATLDRLVQHISYVAELVGIDHVGIGTDFDGLGRTVPVVPEVSQLVYLTQTMLAHGFTAGEIRQVWGGNFLRLLEQNIG